MIESLFKKLDEKLSDRRSAKKEIKRWEDKLESTLVKLDDLEEVRVIFQKASKITQRSLARRVEKIVSSALAAVFDDPYTFVVDFVSRRNSTECDLFFEKNGKRKSPLASCGYGAADIASLALRVAYWKLGKSRNVLALDEPTRNLDLDKQPLASMMIKELSQMKGGLQFAIVSHNIAIAESADRRFQVVKEDNVSHIFLKEKSNA